MAPNRVDDLDFLTPMARAGGAEQPVNIPPMDPKRIPVAPPSRPDTVFNAQGRAWAQDRYGTSDEQAMSDFYNAERMYRRLGPDAMRGISAAMSMQPQKPVAPSNPFGVTPQALQTEYENTYKQLAQHFNEHDGEYQNYQRAQEMIDQAMRDRLGVPPSSMSEEEQANRQELIRRYQDAQEYLNAKQLELSEKREAFIRNNPHFRSLEPYVPIPTHYTPGYGMAPQELPPVPDMLQGYFSDPGAPRGPVAPPSDSGGILPGDTFGSAVPFSPF